MAKVKSTSTNS